MTPNGDPLDQGDTEGGGFSRTGPGFYNKVPAFRHQAGQGNGLYRCRLIKALAGKGAEDRFGKAKTRKRTMCVIYKHL
jgi:hypothetical protein